VGGLLRRSAHAITGQGSYHRIRGSWMSWSIVRP